jgi:serine/threonine protein kinase
MSMEAAGVFRDALLALKVMHDQGWLHRDLKPPNIGMIGKPPRAILLDVGQATYLKPDATLDASPGCGGTLGYLAPERELQAYDQSVDIWAMGIIGYELIYGHHPWKFSSNPWRHEDENEKMRPAFHQRYQEAIDQMTNDYQSASRPQRYIHRGCPSNRARRGRLQRALTNFIAVGGLLVQMLKHPWARKNCGRRIDVDEALQHPAWGPFLPDSRQTKKGRFGD